MLLTLNTLEQRGMIDGYLTARGIKIDESDPPFPDDFPLVDEPGKRFREPIERVAL